MAKVPKYWVFFILVLIWVCQQAWWLHLHTYPALQHQCSGQCQHRFQVAMALISKLATLLYDLCLVLYLSARSSLVLTQSPEGACENSWNYDSAENVSIVFHFSQEQGQVPDMLSWGWPRIAFQASCLLPSFPFTLPQIHWPWCCFSRQVSFCLKSFSFCLNAF